MTLTTIAALIGIVTYLICTAVKCKEIPDSISETAYIVDHPEIFTAVMVVEAALITPPLLQNSDENTAFLAFLTVIGLLVVAFTPNYKEEHRGLHNVGGWLAGAASQVLIALNAP